MSLPDPSRYLILVAHASLCDTVDSEAAHGVTTTDSLSIMEEKSDESQFHQNMTIYLKMRKMSQWTKQMRWRIKKSLPSFVSIDVEPYAVSRLQHN